MKKILMVMMLMISINVFAGVNKTACISCHGANFERKALGKSKVVADMNATEIAKALKGYKNGTYGGPMKGLMKGQVVKYSDADLEAFAKTISK